MVAMATTFYAMLDRIGVQDALVRQQGKDRKLFDTAFTLQAGRGVLAAVILSAAENWPAVVWRTPRPGLKRESRVE